MIVYSWFREGKRDETEISKRMIRRGKGEELTQESLSTEAVNCAEDSTAVLDVESTGLS